MLPPLPMSVKGPALKDLSHRNTVPDSPVRDKSGVLSFSQIDVEPPAVNVPPTDTKPGSINKPLPPESKPMIAEQPEE